MTSTLAGFVVATTPFLAVAGLLWLANLLRHRREACIARQVALTDAIHRELGPAAAPTLRRAIGRGWRVSMAVPLDRPAMVGAIVRVVDRAWSELPPAASEPLEIVLRPRRDPLAPATGSYRRPAPAPVTIARVSPRT